MTCSVRPQVNFAQSAVFAQSLHNVVHVTAAQLINIAVRSVKKSYIMERSYSSIDYYFEKTSTHIAPRQFYLISRLD